MRYFNIFLVITVFAILSISSAQENEIIFDNGTQITKPEMRFRHFEEIRGGNINPDKRRNAIHQMERLQFQADKYDLMQAEQPEWRCIGPFNVSGRVKSIAIHPEDDNIVYIGAAAGGIWKTTDMGESWEPIFDYENGIGFGSISIDENNPDIIYAATGEAVLNSAAPIYLSAGVFKSTDAGDTWKLIGLTQCGSFSKFYVHPANSKRLVGGVVGMGHGFYYSTDAGESWQQSQEFNKNVTDISINPNNENEYLIGVMGEGVYYSNDGGISWSLRNNGIPQSIGRISVQMAPSNSDKVYCLFEEGSNAGIYRSTNKGLSWIRSYTGNSNFFNSQGWYNNYIAVHPENANLVIAGGIDVWKSDNGGETVSSWRNVTNGYSGGNVHVDQHCAAFSKNKQNVLWIGNDGGVYLSNNTGESYSDKNYGLEITQFYGLDFDQDELNRVFGGSQDNGTLGNHNNPDSWSKVNGGDGFRTVLDYEDKNTVYGEVYTSNSVFPFRKNIQNNSYRSLKGGILSNDVSGIWDAPLEIHPSYSFALYHGRQAFYYSFENGNRWLVGIPMQENKFTAIGISPINEELIYAGDIGGGLFVTKDHFGFYENTTMNGLVARPITDIECSISKEETAFASVSGYGTDHIFKTNNAGGRWESISEGFPDIPVNCITVHPENEDWIFAGTDIGVFATFNGGASWLPFGKNLPRTIISGIKILNKTLTGNYILRVSTFGRSMWEVDIPEDNIIDLAITSPVGGEILTGTSDYTFSWYGFDEPVKVEMSHDNGLTWITKADPMWDTKVRFKIPNKEVFDNRLRVTSLSNPEQVKVSNPFSIVPVKKGSVLQTSSYSFVPYGIAMDQDGYLWSTSFYSNQLYKIDKNTLRTTESITLPGDSLFTDLTFDREKDLLYVHRMNSSGDVGTGGAILQLDLEGNLILEYETPAKNYPIGLEMVEQDLVVCDRDGHPKYIYITEPGIGRVWTRYENPFSEYLGPRGICYDGERYLYQASTHFSSGSGVVGTYIVKIDKENYTEVDRMPLVSRNGNINCRGVEYDKESKNFWVTDFGGNIYKVAGFETITEVEESDMLAGVECEISPNPAVDYANIRIYNIKNHMDIELEVVNAAGIVVFETSKGTGSKDEMYINVDTQNLSNGIYFIRIKASGLQITSTQLVVIK